MSQSGKGTQRLTLIRDGEHWRAGEEIEQIGIIQQDLVDVLGSVIKQVAGKKILWWLTGSLCLVAGGRNAGYCRLFNS